MRTRGIDGRCFDCATRPRVVCRGYESASGALIRCGRTVQEGDGPGVQGQCRVCAELQKRAWEVRHVKTARRTASRMETGTLEVELPEDPFEGFREGKE